MPWTIFPEWTGCGEGNRVRRKPKGPFDAKRIDLLEKKSRWDKVQFLLLQKECLYKLMEVRKRNGIRESL